MSDALYRIYPDWKDILVYDEGDGRTLRLDCACLDPIYQVSLPTRDRWNEETPLWAPSGEGSFSIGCVRPIASFAKWADLLPAPVPDGTFRVEVYYEPDERGYPLRSIRVVLNDDNFVLVDLPDAGLAGLLQFPQPGMLTLPFSIQSRKYQIGINVREHFSGAIETKFPDLLINLLPRPLCRCHCQHENRPAAPGFVAWFDCVLGHLFMFVAGRVWQMIDGHKTRDHWIGGAVRALLRSLRRSPHHGTAAMGEVPEKSKLPARINGSRGRNIEADCSAPSQATAQSSILPAQQRNPHALSNRRSALHPS